MTRKTGNINTLVRKRSFVFLISGVLAFFAVFAFATIATIPENDMVMKNSGGNFSFIATSLVKLNSDVLGENFVFFVSFLLIWKLYFSFFISKKEKVRKADVALSILFSLMYIFGISFSKLQSWNFLFLDSYYVIRFGVAFLGLFFLLYIFLYYIFIWIKTMKYSVSVVHKEQSFIDKHFFVVCLFFLLLCWLPALLAFFPGSLPFDSNVQLEQFFGHRGMTADNPVVVTLLLGGLFSLGRGISDNFGLFLYVFFQALLCAVIFSLVCTKLRKMMLSKWISIISLAFYGIIPIWGAAVQCALKDVLHTSFFLWFVLEYAFAFDSDNYCIKHGVFLGLSAIFTIFTRVTAKYIIFLCFLALLLFVNKKSKKKIGIIFLASIFVVVGVTDFLFPALGIHPARKRDTYGLMFQQTALYCIQYGDELSPKELDIINSVLDYDKIIKEYNPTLADPVKMTYHGTDKDLKEYLRLWVKLFFKHPDSYIQATINNSYGYFYPGEIGTGVFRTYIQKSEHFNIYYTNERGIRNILQNYYSLWTKLPVLSVFLSPGFYSWILLICIAFIFREKDKKARVLVFLPSLVLLLGCIASPVNGEVRYVLPMISTLPLLIGITVAKNTNRPVPELREEIQ